MSNPSFGSGFAAVDLSADPGALREYLDRVRALPAVTAAKRESFSLMEVGEGHRVLDLGCGPGDDARELGHIVGRNGAVVGVDKSELLVAEARRSTAEEQNWVQFVCADANALPLRDGSFDSCRADRTIQHVPDADVALAELSRVTKPGGVVVVSEMQNRLDLGGAEPDPITHEILSRFWSEDERRGWMGFLLPLLLARTGFTDVEVHSRPTRLTSFDEVAVIVQLRELCAATVTAGAVESAYAQTWLAALERDFTAGRAALDSVFMHLKARKP